MDYAAHYERLISRARGRVLEGYTERHHIVPKCLSGRPMGGTDDDSNLASLTPEEHYVAHQLLVKLNPHCGPLAYAVVFMARGCTGSRAYGWLRRRLAGIPKSEEHKRKIGAKHKGKLVSPETRRKLAAALLGRKVPPEIAAKSAAARRGLKRKPLSPEVRAKIGAAQRGRKRGPFTPEHRANMSKAMLGNKRGSYKHSPEHIAKQSAGKLAYDARVQAAREATQIALRLGD